VNGVADKPLNILKTSNKSALFLLSSRVHNPNKYCNLCSWDSFFTNHHIPV